MAGSAICRVLESAGYHHLLTASRSELDLLDVSAVEDWFSKYKPTVVVLAAAKVGGIRPTAGTQQIFGENLKIQTHVIETAWRGGCVTVVFRRQHIYPKFADQPIREEALLTGP